MILTLVFSTAFVVSSCGGDDEPEDIIVKDPIVGTSWEGNSSSDAYRFDFLENSVKVTASKNAVATKSAMGTWSKGDNGNYTIVLPSYAMECSIFIISVEGDKATAQGVGTGMSKFTLYKVKG